MLFRSRKSAAMTGSAMIPLGPGRSAFGAVGCVCWPGAGVAAVDAATGIGLWCAQGEVFVAVPIEVARDHRVVESGGVECVLGEAARAVVAQQLHRVTERHTVFPLFLTLRGACSVSFRSAIRRAVCLFGATGGGTDAIFYENGQNVTTDYTITSGTNAMSAGDITIDTGVTVTVPDGSNWIVV